MNKEIRWRQRFQNFEKAFLQLAESLQIQNPTNTERAGLIQFFEVTFELAWKTLKDHLESQGFQVASPRATLKQAFQSNLIENGHVWMEAMEDRNLTTHTYNETNAKQIEEAIRTQYFPILEALHRKLSSLKNDFQS